MTQPWVAERTVEPAQALELVRAQFPALDPRGAVSLGAGWDNTAVLLETSAGAVVFRFPRRSSTVELLRRETQLLPRIAPALPLSIPLPEWVGAPAEAYPWPFSGYRLLPGRIAVGAGWGGEAARAAAVALGGFLAALHRVSLAGLDVPGDVIGRMDVVARRPVVHERLAALADAGLVPAADPWRELLDTPVPPVPPTRVLVHGDLYGSHLLMNQQGALTGVIDWGDAHAGCAAVDLSAGWILFDGEARRAFLAAYGPVPDEMLRLARLRAALHSINTARYAHAVGDTELLAASLAAMANVLAD